MSTVATTRSAKPQIRVGVSRSPRTKPAVEEIERGADEILEKPTGGVVDPAPLRRRIRRSRRAPSPAPSAGDDEA